MAHRITLFDSYLQEYMWKKQHKDKIFGNVLYWISFYTVIILTRGENNLALGFFFLFSPGFLLVEI